MANGDNNDLAAIRDELVAIKRLIILSLLRSGASQSDVAGALGVGQATVSRMFPKAGNKRTQARRPK